MALDKLDIALEKEVEQLKAEGRAKMPERVLNGYIPPQGNKGPRYKIKGHDQEFIRMNSNSYLSLSKNPKMVAAADEATHKFGVGPGAVRFIDGTFEQHIALEERIASFTNKPSAKIFNSAYTANLALGLTLNNKETYWIGDELNHNSIIRSMRISNVPRTNRSIYKHNNLEELEKCLSNVPKEMKRVCVIFDGIFSMRGDYAPIDQIQEITQRYHDQFEHGVITIVDDSHGIAAYGKTGRGTSEYANMDADIQIGTFGKAFGVNGGYISGSKSLTESVRQKADTYIYTNPLSVADCAAAVEAINIVDSNEGINLLKGLKEKTQRFRNGIDELGFESIPGPHPIVPIVTRDTKKTHEMVQKLFEDGVLVVGLTFPVVPKNAETIRVQINAGLTNSDVDYVLGCLKKLK